jgi:hypothetical protein
VKDVPLVSVNVVTDDSTGLYTVGELDFGIHLGPLDTFLRRGNVYQRRDEVLAMFGYLAHRICEESDKVNDEQHKASGDVPKGV